MKSNFACVFSILLILFQAASGMTLIPDDERLEEVVIPTKFTQFQNNSIYGDLSYNSNNSTLFSMQEFGIVNISMQEWMYRLNNSQSINFQYKSVLYELHIFPTDATTECNQFFGFENFHSYYGWTTNSKFDIVNLVISDQFIDLWIRDSNLGKDLYVVLLNDDIMDTFNIISDTNYIFIYDSIDYHNTFNNGIDWIPYNFSNRVPYTVPSQLINPNTNQPAILFGSDRLFRMGIYFDDFLSDEEIKNLCIAMSRVHALFRQFNVWIQIEFIDHIESNNIENSGYKQWPVNAAGSETDLCQKGRLGSSLRKYIKSNEYGEIPPQDDITSIIPFDNWTDWNRGKFIDSAIFVTDDNYWDHTFPACADSGIRGVGKVEDLDSFQTVIVDYSRSISFSHRTHSDIDILSIILAHEIGHNFDLTHSDGTCEKTGIFRTIHTIMSVCGLGFFDVMVFEFSPKSQNELFNVSNPFSLVYIDLFRNYSIPAQTTDYRVQSIKLVSHIIDHYDNVISDCGVLYRLEYIIENTGITDIEIIEAFNAIESNYRRNLPGEWDYWLGYHRSQVEGMPAIILSPEESYTFNLPNYQTDIPHFGVRFLGSGFIKDETFVECPSSGEGSLGLSPPPNANEALMNIHMDQPNWPNGLSNYQWSFHPSINIGDDYRYNATYILFNLATITYPVWSSTL